MTRSEHVARTIKSPADAVASADPFDLKPRAPHDDLSFQELAARYNFERTSDRSRVFTRLLIKECQARRAPVNVLDIGCGKGIELFVNYQWAIREHAQEYWGLEPDPSIAAPPGLFDRWQTALMEDAELPGNHFDLAYSFMVMEHVDDPERFMRAVARCLKPGGTYVFATPNRRHYFTRIASTLHRLRLDEIVLRAVKRDEVDSYHYPVRYRFNDERSIGACARRVGLLQPEFVYLEELGPISYFPRPLRFIYHALAAKRRLIKKPNALITMVARIAKPAAGSKA